MPTASSSERLPRAFFVRPSLAVARDLLGRLLVRTLRDGTRLVGRLVEVEAYRQDDPASHSYRGRTARTDVMFGPPGHLYVYFTYGMHFCMNVVTGELGEGSAVLLRAVEPLVGLDLMARRRARSDPRLLCAGPARLSQSYAVTRAENGMDLAAGDDLFVSHGRPVGEARSGISARVGISVARERRWRFFELGSPFVSRGPRLTEEAGSPRS